MDEYLHTSYEPRCEYVNGALVSKAMGTKKHGKIQRRLVRLIEDAFPNYQPTPEQTVRISGSEYRTPDVTVEFSAESQDPYPITPVHLCIEIISPGDRVSETLKKCEIYHEWGVPHTWIIDPQTRRAWQYAKGSKPVEIAQVGELTAGEIHLSLAEIFAVL